MNSLIKETNDNLKTIIDTLKGNLDSSINSLENIQIQMDKKVEEAKKYKIQVDEAKEKIKELEDTNKSLELSLKELHDKYSKMNLLSVIEAGNREIKAKINDNVREVNKQKEYIAELTSKARTIKDLLMNLKKDKTAKEDRLEGLKVVYEYYSTRVNDVIDYAFNHSENLVDFREVSFFDKGISFDDNIVVDAKDLDNTMLFDEIASIDNNKNFKDEMSFISDQIDKNIDYKTLDEEDNEETGSGLSVNLDEDLNNELNVDINDELNKRKEPMSLEEAIDMKYAELTGENVEDVSNVSETFVQEDINNNTNDIDEISKEMESLNNFLESDLTEDVVSNDVELVQDEAFSNIEENVEVVDNNLVDNVVPLETMSDSQLASEDAYLDEQNEARLNKINNLFSTLDNIEVNPFGDNLSVDVDPLSSLENQIDNAYQDSFGQSITEENKVDSTMTDIFGNPIASEVVEETNSKKIEDLFIENGLDFNKFKEDEQSYLKQIYDEEKFKNIFATLNRNKISLENVYDSFNIFGEISANELEGIISKLLNIGQSVEAIGFILEKLPRVKKYNLDEAIMSYGDYIKDIDITELIMKAKELYKNGGNN